MIAGSLTKKNGRWYAILSYKDSEGKYKQKWISTGLSIKGNKKLAEEILINLRTEYTEKLKIENNPTYMTFSDYMILWLQSMKNTVKETTYCSYKLVVEKHIVPYFKEREIRIDSINERDIEEYYNSLYMAGISSNTILKHHANIRKALEEARVRRYILYNPADNIIRPKKKKFVTFPYNSEEAIQLIEAIKGNKLELVILLSLFYGLRRSEVLGLRWQAIDFENNLITIYHSVVRVQGDDGQYFIGRDDVKGHASYRSFPLESEIQKKLLKKQAQCYPDGYIKMDDYICTDENGELFKPDYVTRYFKKTLIKNSLRVIRFHDLRHTSAKLLLSTNVPLHEIQQWMGHASIDTTIQLYGHFDFSQKIKSANKLKKTEIIEGELIWKKLISGVPTLVICLLIAKIY